MKTKLLLTALLFISSLAGGQITFHKTYGRFGQDHSSCVRQTADGGYIAAGTSPGNPGSDWGSYIVKTDQHGDTLWTRIFGGNYLDGASEIQQTADGGYILAGTSYYSAGNSDIAVIKTDASGNILWNKRYDHSQGDQGNSVFQTNDGGYIIAGTTYSAGGTLQNICLLKTDANGNLTWTKITGGSADDYCASVIQTNDSGYVLYLSQNII